MANSQALHRGTVYAHERGSMALVSRVLLLLRRSPSAPTVVRCRPFLEIVIMVHKTAGIQGGPGRQVGALQAGKVYLVPYESLLPFPGSSSITRILVMQILFFSGDVLSFTSGRCDHCWNPRAFLYV